MFPNLFPTISVAAFRIGQHVVVCQDIMDIDGFDADLNLFGPFATTPRPATTSMYKSLEK
jgi:hypothetical protein